MADLARMCHAKHTYLAEITARIEAAKVKRKFGYSVRAYRCPNCGFWHLTSKNP